MRLLFISTLFLISCNTNKIVPENSLQKPKNIILLIGDGMGLAQITAGLYSNNNFLNIERFQIIGLHKNYSFDNLVTDSAAGATAFSCGVKTYNGAIGVDSDTISLKTILEEASEQGLKTGLVASSSITHATPASFAAHNKSRSNYEEISIDMVDSGTDIMIGGGKNYFNKRTIDNRDLYAELKSSGYTISDYSIQDFQNVDFNNIGDKFVYLTADGEPTSFDKGRKYLVPASERAIEFLNTKSKGKGFFMMIEGSQIDWAGHDNDFEFMISEMKEFDQVVKVALDYAEKDGNTLVIMTADHETGGLSINTGSELDSLVAKFTTTSHTAVMIPVFAYGPGAESFSGIYENTAIYSKMRKALRLDIEKN